MTVASMITLSSLLILWSLIVGVYFYYRKAFELCDNYKAIRCWNDWECEKLDGTYESHPSFQSTGVYGTLDSDYRPSYTNLLKGTNCSSVPVPNPPATPDEIPGYNSKTMPNCKPAF